MKKILNPFGMLITGLILGVVSRLLDIYTQNLGNMFSELAIWILLGTIISIYSESKKKAMFNVLPFCIGMLITYYVVAALTNGVYSWTFIAGWSMFAFLSPVMAYFAWMSKEKGVFPKIISAGIVLASIFSSIVLFDRLRVYDYIIDATLVYVLFFKKVERKK